MSILPTPVKSCTNPECTCENPQPLEAFSKDKSQKDGRQKRCKTCNRNYNAANLERITQRRAQYRQGRRAELAAKQRDYYSVNKDARLSYGRSYQVLNRSSIRAQKKAYRQRNRVAVLQYFRAYRRANRERLLSLQRQYRAENLERCRAHSRLGAIRRRARLLSAPGDFTSADIAAKLELQGGLCYYCEADLSETGYHVDHKIPLARGGSNWPANLCCACPDCNVRKNDRDFWEFLEQAA